MPHAADTHDRRRRVLCLALLPVLAFTVLASALTGCTILHGVEGSAQEDRPQISRSSTAPTSPLPVYWLGDAGPRTYLYREYVPYQPTEAAAPGDVIATAVATMAAGSPQDPDHRNPWHELSRVGASISQDGTITLDLSQDMFNHELSEAEARSALQQLIYTATAAAANSGIASANPTTPVILRVEGSSGYR